MPTDLLLNAFKNGWLTPPEQEALASGFKTLAEALDTGRMADPLAVSPVFSALYLYAGSGSQNRQAVLSLVPFFTGTEEEPTVAPALKPLLQKLWAEIQGDRVGTILEKINGRDSLSPSNNPADYRATMHSTGRELLYENKSDKLNIDFNVTRLPFPLEVLDPRVVSIPPGKTNELHKHAHETVFVFFEGRGHVRIDGLNVPAQAGDIIFIPRWSLHQSVNEGETEMVFLAVADFGLTGRSFTGNYMKTTRLKPV